MIEPIEAMEYGPFKLRLCDEDEVRKLEQQLNEAVKILQSWKDGENPWKETTYFLSSIGGE